MIIDCISDLHGSFPELEGGDLLIIAGDMTANNSMNEELTEEQKDDVILIYGDDVPQETPSWWDQFLELFIKKA